MRIYSTSNSSKPLIISASLDCFYWPFIFINVVDTELLEISRVQNKEIRSWCLRDTSGHVWFSENKIHNFSRVDDTGFVHYHNVS